VPKVSLLASEVRKSTALRIRYPPFFRRGTFQISNFLVLQLIIDMPFSTPKNIPYFLPSFKLNLRYKVLAFSPKSTITKIDTIPAVDIGIILRNCRNRPRSTDDHFPPEWFHLYRVHDKGPTCATPASKWNL
jgi:hypothetical protein